MAENKGILDGVKVLSSCTVVAGPFAAGMLAENGADVVSIEHPVIPDTGKLFGLLYNAEHRNQRSLAMDVKDAAGKEVFTKLIADMDIFLEASRPGVWDRLGFSDEELWKINPALVICHISGYGQSGDPEYVSKASYDMIGQAFGGTMALNGMPGDDMPPMYAKPYICDYITGLTASFACTSALLKARATGKGESIDVAMFEIMARMQAGYSVEGLTDGKQPVRNGACDAVAAFDVVFKTSDDKWCVLAIAKPNKPWMEALGLMDDPDFGSLPFISWAHPRAAEYVQISREFVRKHTLDEMMDMMKEMKLAASPVMDYAMMNENSHYNQRGTIIKWYDETQKRELTGITSIPRFKNNPGGIWRGAPTLGMDNNEVLGGLGYTEEQIAELAAKGVIAQK